MGLDSLHAREPQPATLIVMPHGCSLLFHLCLAMCSAACTSTPAHAPPGWSWEEVRAELLQLADRGGEVTHKQLLSVGSPPVDVTLRATTKGNGTLQIQNLTIRALDEHDDGQLYANNALDVQLIDIDSDRDLDLLVSGTVLTTEEQSDRVTRHDSIVYLYRYDHQRQRFVKIFSASPNSAIVVDRERE